MSNKTDNAETRSLHLHGSGLEAALADAREARDWCAEAGETYYVEYWQSEINRLERLYEPERRSSTTDDPDQRAPKGDVQ